MRWVVAFIVAAVLVLFLPHGCSRKVSISSGAIVFFGR
jgi:hypothetical protein